MRPGAPDPLYSAIAPARSVGQQSQPRRRASTTALPQSAIPRTESFHRTQPVHKGETCVPASWNNPAYLEALENDKRPKKQKDKEREKERETLEDWSYFRPTLTRLLEITDLGPLGALAPRVEDIMHPQKQRRAR